MESRSLAISETCDFERLLIPNDATRSFILRVETPLRWQVASERGQGPFGAGAPFQQPVREEGTGPQFRDGDVDGTDAGIQRAVAVPVADVGAGLRCGGVLGAADLVGLGGEDLT